MTRHRLRLVGEVTIVRSDGRELRLPSPKSQAVLARLVIDRETGGSARDELAAVVWPDGAPDTWSSALRSILTRVRRFLAEADVGDTDIESRNGRHLVRLPAALEVDLEELSAFVLDGERSAEPDPARVQILLATLERSFLPDNTSSWADETRSHIDELRSKCYEFAALQLTKAGDFARAEAIARTAVEAAPLRESGHRALMRAQLAAGNRADALRTFAHLKRLLVSELGVAPSEATGQVYLTALGTDAGEQRRSRDTGTDAPFVGRLDDLRALTATWQSAEQQPRLMLVTGEPGMGKTRLLQEFVRTALTPEDTAIWCHGKAASPAHSALAEGVLFLADALSAEPGEQVSTATEAVRRHRFGEDADTLLSAALKRAVVALAVHHGPLLVLLDDVPAIDDVSLRALYDAVVEHPALPITIVATSDPTQALKPGRAALLAAGETVCHTQHRALRRLGPSQVHEITWQLAPPEEGDERSVGELVRRSGGNPYLLLSQLRPDGAGVDTLSYYCSRRLDGISGSSLRFLQVAATSADSFEPEIIGAAAGFDDATTSIAVQELSRRQLLMDGDQPGTCGFVHGLVRESIYRDLPESQRRRMHQQIADQIWSRRSHVISRYADELAIHLEGAGESGQVAADGYLLAASRARSVGADRRAEELLHRALNALPECDGRRAQVNLDLGELALASARSTAIGHMMSGVYDAMAGNSVTTALSATSMLADAYTAGVRDTSDLGRQHDLVALIEMMSEQLERVPDEELRTMTAPALAVVAHGIRLQAAGSTGLQARLTELCLDRVRGPVTPVDATPAERFARDLGTLADHVGDRAASIAAGEHGLACASVLGSAERYAVHRGALCNNDATDTVTRSEAARSGRDTPAQFAADHRQLWANALLRQSLGLQGAGVGRDPREPGDIAAAHLLSGRGTQARHAVAVELRRRRDRHSPFALYDEGLLALTVVPTGSEAELRTVQHRLDAWAGLTCAAGHDLYAGPVSLHQGRVAARLGSFDRAERELTNALEQLATWDHTDLWVALACHELSRVMLARGERGDEAAADELAREARALIADAVG
ncbi:BTAD domain-containing putative transcriptional regulator [Flexivirga meconopsidis]|uniref:BTAD domain-containing putative transcriptional regulator n=1 Tax=Flexivirga meconopsidis TaxID=2977121 RepID=UPI00223F23BE